MKLFSFVLGLLLVQGQVFALDPIKIGVALKMNPSENSFGGAIYQGIQLATQGTGVELVPFPVDGSTESSEKAARAILEKKIKFLIAGEMSDEALTIAKTIHDEKVLFMSPTASQPMLTVGNPLVFRVGYSDDEVAEKSAQYLIKKMSSKKVGVLHNTRNAYADYLTSSVLSHFDSTKTKLPRFTVFRFASESPDFTSAAQKFKSEGVELVLAFTLRESLKAFLKAAHSIDYHPVYFGSDGWGTDESLRTMVQGLSEDLKFVGIRNSYWSPNTMNPALIQFKKKFLAQYHVEPNAWHAIGFDTGLTLVRAIKSARNKNDPEEVAEVLRTLKINDSVTVPALRFNSKNSVVRPLFLQEFNKGKVTFINSHQG